jgi:putative acetyltransferase
MTPILREARKGDFAGASELLSASFGGGAEAEVVKDLRKDGDMLVEYVAEDAKGLAGYIAFFRIDMDPPANMKVAGLGPLAVREDKQGKGLATKLIEMGLQRMQRDGIGFVAVLGAAAVYAPHGFAPEPAEALECRFAGPHLLGLPFSARMARPVGEARYPKAFDAF